MDTAHPRLRALSAEEILVVSGGDFVDSNCNGQYDEGEEIVVKARSSIDTSGGGGGSFMGGGWLSAGTGAGVWGGGGASHGSWLLGAGGGFILGYSSDPATAAADGDQTKSQLPGPVGTIDFDPFTLEFGFNWGAAISVAEKHNYCPLGGDYVYEPYVQ